MEDNWHYIAVLPTNDKEGRIKDTESNLKVLVLRHLIFELGLYNIY